MRWRYLLLGLAFAALAAFLTYCLPLSPAFHINAGENATYLTDEPAKGELWFLQSDATSYRPTAIAKYDANTGTYLATTNLDWSGLDNYQFTRHRSFTSENRAVLCCFQLIESGANENVAALFDAETGRQLGFPICFGYFGSFQISPDGQRIAYSRKESTCQLIVRDSHSTKQSIPTDGPRQDTLYARCCFSHDSQHLIYQWWHSDVGGLRESDCKLFQIALTNPLFVKEHELPIALHLQEWRMDELVMTTWDPLTEYYETARLKFVDMERVGHPTFDPLLRSEVDRDYLDVVISKGNDWTARLFAASESAHSNFFRDNRLVNRFVPYMIRAAVWPRGDQFIRIMDRKSSRMKYQLPIVGDGYKSSVAMDANLVVVHCGDVFDVYKTDIWPRWLLSTLAGIIAVLSFAVFARIRHRQIQRRLPNH